MVSSNFDKLPEAIRKTAQDFVGSVVSGFVPHKCSVVLYGEFLEDTDRVASGVSSAIVVETIELAQVEMLAKCGRTFGRQGFIAPLLFSTSSLNASAESFPLDLLAIVQQHLHLAGPEVFSTIDIDRDAIRKQCRRELESLQIGLPQAFATTECRSQKLGMLADLFRSQVLRIMRGTYALKLSGQPETSTDVITKSEKMLERSLPGIRALAGLVPIDRLEQWESICDDVCFLQKWIDLI